VESKVKSCLLSALKYLRVDIYTLNCFTTCSFPRWRPMVCLQSHNFYTNREKEYVKNLVLNYRSPDL